MINNDVRDSLSRKDNETYVCNTCGTAEAIADMKSANFATTRRAMDNWR